MTEVVRRNAGDEIAAGGAVRHFLLGAVLLGLLLIVLQTLSAVLIPFLQAAFIAVIAAQPSAWLRNKGFGQLLSVLVVVTCLVLLFVLVGTLGAASLRDVGERIPAYEARLEQLTMGLVAWIQQLGLEPPVEQIDRLIEPSELLRTIALVGQRLGSFLGHTIFVLIIVVFTLLEVPRMTERMERLSGDQPRTLEQFRQFTSSMNRYLIIKTWISLGTGVTLGLLLYLIGLDYSFLWGLLAFCLNYIPSIGSIVAALPPITLAFFQLGTGWGFAAMGICILVNIVFANILEPRVLGRGLRVSPVIILFSLVTWGWVFGATGVFLAVPLTVMVRFLLERREETRWIGVLLGAPTAVKEES